MSDVRHYRGGAPASVREIDDGATGLSAPVEEDGVVLSRIGLVPSSHPCWQMAIALPH